MSWDAVGAIGEIVGAIAVVFSLIYLATQIKVSNTASRNSLVQELQDTTKTVFQMNISEAEVVLKGREDFGSLTATEEFKFHLLMLQSLIDHQRMYYLNKNSEIDSWLYETWQHGLVIFLSSSGVREWYSKYENMVDSEFHKVILKRMTEIEEGTMSW
ncbi:MAG: putative thioredoxin/glutaredoxin [Polaribacter sp.]|jgi:predicted thioredoxin/glutaredoxin